MSKEKNEQRSHESAIEGVLKKGLGPYFLIIGLMTLFFSWRAFVRNDSWTIGDWLINYQGGFVRRGLIGELIFQLSHITSLAPKYFAMGMHAGCYGALFYFAWRVLRKQKYIIPLTPFLISPIAFTYQIHATAGGFRKEILYLALLSWVIYAASLGDDKKLNRAFNIACLVFPAVILCHEMTAFLLPYIVAAYFIGSPEISIKKLLVTAFKLVPSVVAFVLCFMFQGGSEYVEAIKLSLGDQLPIDRGAIDWMGVDTKYGYEQVLYSIANHNYIPRHVLYFALSMIAFIPLLPRLKKIIQFPIALALVVLSAVAMIALSFVAIDWGRFLYISLFSLFMLMLLLPESHAVSQKVTAFFSVKPKLIQMALLLCFLLFAVVYSIGWYVPHCCNWSPYVGDLTRKIFLILGIQL